MIDKARAVMRAVSLVKDAVEVGTRMTSVLSAPRGERRRRIIEECGAFGGGVIGGSLGAAAGGKIGCAASPAGSLVGACLGSLAGGLGGERLGRGVAGALYDKLEGDEPVERATVVEHPYHAPGRAKAA
jgi:hypothetical protein